MERAQWDMLAQHAIIADFTPREVTAIRHVPDLATMLSWEHDQVTEMRETVEERLRDMNAAKIMKDAGE